eukprot:SAG31_NODE_10_length_40133_cov_27.863041_12_plen_175_part_00
MHQIATTRVVLATRSMQSTGTRRLRPIVAHVSTGIAAVVAADSDGSTAVETEAQTSATFDEVADAADAHLIQPYDMLDGKNTTMVQAGGRGIYLITETGKEIIDGPGGMWNVQVGYGEKRVAEAIGRQALTMAYNSPWHNTSSPAAQLAEKIATLAPAGLNRVFFTTGAPPPSK